MRKIRQNPFLLTWIFMLILFIGHSVPTRKIGEFQETGDFFSVALSDMVLHIMAFGILVWIICHGYEKYEVSKLPYAKILLITMAFGVLVEIWQILLPYRACKIKDMFFNLVGSISALFLFYMIKGRWKFIRQRFAGKAEVSKHSSQPLTKMVTEKSSQEFEDKCRYK